MKRVLVLCTGNACRSQMAEGYLNFYAGDKGRFFSAGLEEHGLHPVSVQVMDEDNIDISGNWSKKYNVFEDQHFDFLITVCDDVQNRLPDDLSFLHHLHFSIPNPIKVKGNREQQLRAFREAREIVKKSMLKFIGMELIGMEESVLV